jgi:hypothetical protein
VQQEVVEVIEVLDGVMVLISLFSRVLIWGILKMEIMQLFHDFCGSAKLPFIFSSYFITLISKTPNRR